MKNKYNISNSWWQDISNLKDNSDIISHRSGAVAITNAKHFIKMLSDNSNNEKTWNMFELNCDAKVMKGIAKILKKCKDNLTTTTTKSLTSFSYNLSNFYGLNKINKFKVIQKGTKEQQKKYVHIYWTIRFETKTN